MAQQCAPHSTVAGGCRGFLGFCSGIQPLLKHDITESSKVKKPQKTEEDTLKTPKL